MAWTDELEVAPRAVDGRRQPCHSAGGDKCQPGPACWHGRTSFLVADGRRYRARSSVSFRECVAHRQTGKSGPSDAWAGVILGHNEPPRNFLKFPALALEPFDGPDILLPIAHGRSLGSRQGCQLSVNDDAQLNWPFSGIGFRFG